MKVRGCRIELGEIEHALLGHPDIQAAIVILRDDLAGEARLVAHTVAATGRQPEVNELRDFLRTKLPDYMIPAGFIFLERMPLTVHGKVDRQALVATSRQLAVAASEFVAPRNTVEQILADIWALLLGIDHVGIFRQLLRFRRSFPPSGPGAGARRKCPWSFLADKGALRRAYG